MPPKSNGSSMRLSGREGSFFKMSFSLALGSTPMSFDGAEQGFNVGGTLAGIDAKRHDILIVRWLLDSIGSSALTLTGRQRNICLHT